MIRICTHLLVVNFDTPNQMPLMNVQALVPSSCMKPFVETSPSPFQDRGGREGGVVAATSRDTITQHI